MLVEPGVVERRYDAVKEVLDGGATVTEVAERHGVTRRSLHNWLRRYRERGLAGVGRPVQAAQALPRPHASALGDEGPRGLGLLPERRRRLLSGSTAQ